MDACLIALPEELLSNIFSFLYGRDLAALRLTCKPLQQSASRALFSSVCCSMSDMSIEWCRGILEHPEFSKYVRLVEHEVWVNGYDFDRRTATEVVFGLVKRFPNVTSVGLRLCVGLVDSYELRLFAVEKLLTMMADPALSKVTKLRLENLQLSNDVEYMQSDKVLNVLSRLTALDLAFSAAYYTVSDYEEEEPYTFTAELRQLWLEPASTNLTTLSLHQNVYLGYLPKLDLRGLHFRKLRTLGLGKYVFSHDWQLDWLSSHSTTLENLYLDNCIIVYFGVFTCLVDEGYYPDAREYAPDCYHFYNQTWSRIFTHCRESLGQLRSFRFVRSNMGFGSPIADGQLGWGLHNNFYRVFNNMNDPLYERDIYHPAGEVNVEGIADVEVEDVQKATAFDRNLKTQLVDDMTALELLPKESGQMLCLPRC